MQSQGPMHRRYYGTIYPYQEGGTRMAILTTRSHLSASNKKLEDGERDIAGWEMGDSYNLSGLRRLRQLNESSATMAAKP